MPSLAWFPTGDLALRIPLTHRLCVACIVALLVMSVYSTLPKAFMPRSPTAPPIHSFLTCGGVPTPC